MSPLVCRLSVGNSQTKTGRAPRKKFSVNRSIVYGWEIACCDFCGSVFLAGGADKKLDTPVSDWSPHVPVGDQGARRGGRRGGVQPDRGGRAGRLQPHGRCKLGEGGGRRPAAPQEGRILALRQEDGARRAAGGRGAGRRPRRRGRRHRRCRLRLAPAAPRGRGALPHDRLGHRRPRAGAPRGALGARGAQGPLRGAGAAQRRPRGDDRHTKKRPRRRPVRPDGGGEGGAG